jgi:small GTP-binding protein
MKMGPEPYLENKGQLSLETVYKSMNLLNESRRVKYDSAIEIALQTEKFPKTTPKLIQIGDAGVGKTAMIRRYMKGKFEEDYVITIAVDFQFKSVDLGSDIVSLLIFDIGGQPRFEQVRQGFMKDADLILAVCDLTRRQSLENLLEYWLPEAIEVSASRAIIQLVGNKLDLEELRVLDSNDLTKAATVISLRYPDAVVLPPRESSVATNIGVSETYETMITSYSTEKQRKSNAKQKSKVV